MDLKAFGTWLLQMIPIKEKNNLSILKKNARIWSSSLLKDKASTFAPTSSKKGAELSPKKPGGREKATSPL